MEYGVNKIHRLPGESFSSLTIGRLLTCLY